MVVSEMTSPRFAARKAKRQRHHARRSRALHRVPTVRLEARRARLCATAHTAAGIAAFDDKRRLLIDASLLAREITSLLTARGVHVPCHICHGGHP